MRQKCYKARLAFVLMASLCAAGGAGAGTSELERVFARGVYWPWERTQGNADDAGKELWAFVDDTMAMLKRDGHCNVIWFVNGPSDPARVCDLAEKNGLMVLPGTSFVPLFIYGIRDEAQIKEAARKTVAVLGKKKACAGYVLKDEPKPIEVAQMEEFRRALQREDPSRPSVIVTMTWCNESYALRTGFPILCSDIYPFGGPRSPNIANTAATSQRSYRDSIAVLADLAVRNGKIAWVTAQATSECWGPWWYDKDNNLVIEPGAYWHLRMPTVTEMRWQTWEALRGGCKGVLYFGFLLGAKGKDPWTPAKREMPDRFLKKIEANKAQKLPMVTNSVFTGAPFAITLPGGAPTDQLRAMGEDFKVLESLEKMLMTLRPALFPCVFAANPVSVATFEGACAPMHRYAVVVNDNLNERKTLDLLFLPHTAAVTDLVARVPIALQVESAAADPERMLRGCVSLEPGAGTVLEMTFANNDPGRLLLQEDFAAVAMCVALTNAERRLERRRCGMTQNWVVRKTGAADQQSAISLAGLSPDLPGGAVPYQALTGALCGFAKKTARVYLWVDGRFPTAESLVVEAAGRDGKSARLKSSNYELPALIPNGTDTLRLLLSSNAAVTKLCLWRIPVVDSPTNPPPAEVH